MDGAPTAIERETSTRIHVASFDGSPILARRGSRVGGTCVRKCEAGSGGVADLAFSCVELVDRRSQMRRRHRLSVALLLLVFAIATDAYWTDRLGLAFKDDCQEHPLIVRGWFAWAASWLGGRKGVQVGEACEQKETRCPESRFVTGIQVRYGRGRHDRDSYDFNVRCAKMWNGWLGLRFQRLHAERLQFAGLPPDFRAARVKKRGAYVGPFMAHHSISDLRRMFDDVETNV